MTTAKKKPPAKKAAAKKAAAKSPAKSDAQASETVVSEGLAVGDTWSVEASESVEFTRPDGSVAVVAPRAGVARFVVAAEGEYSAVVRDESLTIQVT